MSDTITIREKTLTKAISCVCGDRERDYGTPEDNFGIIAQLWTTYLGMYVTPIDVAMMMALLKIARIKSGGGTGDSFVDLAGYAACGAEIFGNETEALKARESGGFNAEKFAKMAEVMNARMREKKGSDDDGAS